MGATRRDVASVLTAEMGNQAVDAARKFAAAATTLLRAGGYL